MSRYASRGLRSAMQQRRPPHLLLQSQDSSPPSLLTSHIKHASVWSHLSGSLDALTPDFTSIPVLDLQPIQSLDPVSLTFPSSSSSPPPASLSSLVQSLHAACSNVGFFFIRNHDVPSALLSSAFSQSRSFFSLPLQSKLSVSCRDSPNRGYFSIGEENLGDKEEGDQKEGWDMGIEVSDSQLLDAAMQRRNRWPSAVLLPAFRPAMERYFAAMMGLSRRLCWLLAHSLSVPHARFASITQHPMASLRLTHYPPLDPRRISSSHLGAGAHTDYGLLTVVAQTQPGLEARNRRGDWIALPHEPELLVVNLGDMTQRLSGGLYVSTPHRVVNAGQHGRLSIPFFYEPDIDAVITVCPELQQLPGVTHYDSISFGDHLRSMYENTYAKVGQRQSTQAAAD